MKKIQKRKNFRKGFTLVELIVVLAILAILTAMVVPALVGWIDKAKNKQEEINARTVYLAAQTIATEKYAEVSSDQDFDDLWGGMDGVLEVSEGASDIAAEIYDLAAIAGDYTAQIRAENGKVTGMKYIPGNANLDPVIIGEFSSESP